MLFRHKVSLAFLAIVALQMILIQDQMTSVSASKKWLRKLLWLCTLINRKKKIVPLPLPLPIPIPLRIQKKDHVEVVEGKPQYHTYEDVYAEPSYGHGGGGDYDGYGDSYAAASSHGEETVSQPDSSDDYAESSSTRVKTIYKPKSKTRRVRYYN